MQHPFTSGPRGLMVAANLWYSIGAFAFDWNETHVKNPKWPPHARFHNGQTMSLGVLLTSIVVYLLSRAASSKSTSGAKDAVWLAAVIGSFYCTAGFTAILYPGTDWNDPGSPIPHAVQKGIFGFQLVANWLAYWLEMARLEKENEKLKQ